VATLLDEVATYIAANVAGHTLGTNFFKGLLPDTPDLATAIYEYGGGPGNLGFGTPGLKDELSGLQVVTRGAAGDYTNPRARIEAVYKQLPRVQGTTLSGAYYRMIRPQQSPFIMEIDAANRKKFVCNFLVEKELSP
jgi:hypothetical protein